MTVLGNNHNKLISFIANWLHAETNKRQAKGLFVASNNNLNCAIAGFICRRAGIPFACINGLGDYGKNRYNINFELFSNTYRLPLEKLKDDFFKLKDVESSFKDKIYLYNAYWRCKADESRFLIVGSFDREEFVIDKPWQSGIFDVMPLADLYKDELFSIGLSIGIKDKKQELSTLSEWLVREEDRIKILSGQKDPTKNKYWAGYSMEQKQYIAKSHNTIIKTRYKPEIPICKIRKSGFVV